MKYPFPQSLLDGEIELLRSPEPQDYETAQRVMNARRAAIREGTARPLVWFLEHPPLLTRGSQARADELLAPARFPVYDSERGGALTYHGPGQRVVYCVLPLAQFGKDVRAFVRALQAAVARTVAQFGVRALRDNPAVGVWVERDARAPAKIAALGLHLRHWISTHGVSLNVAPDLAAYEAFVPCGRAGDAITSLAAMGVRATMEEVDAVLVRALEEVLRELQDSQSRKLQHQRVHG